MTNVVSMKEGAILDPKVIESIVMNGDLSIVIKGLQPDAEGGLLQLSCSRQG
jgi:hypothetical protein